MKIPQFAVFSLLTIGAFALSPISRAAEPAENILANALPGAPSYKPTATFSDTYGEKVVTTDGSHDVMANPEKLAAKVVANLAGFDFAGEISDEMAIGLSVGGFSFEATLGESAEALKSDSGFPLTGKKATFPFSADVELDNGNTVTRKVGSITFAWTTKLLTATLAMTDGELAGWGEIGAPDFVGLYSDESEAGNRPSGSVKIDGAGLDVSVTFGSVTGQRIAYGKGVSTTKNKRFGSGDEAEDVPLQSVTLTGAFDTTAPKVTGAIPAADGDADGVVTFTLAVADTPAANDQNGLAAPTLEIALVGSDGRTDSLSVEATTLPESGSGPALYEVTLGLLAPTTTMTLLATDESGNATTVTKTITSTATAFNGAVGKTKPIVTGAVPTTDDDNDRSIEFSLFVLASPAPNLANQLPPPTVTIRTFVNKFTQAFAAFQPTEIPAEGNAPIRYDIDLPLLGATTSVSITVRDANGNQTILERTVTSGGF